MSAGAQLERRSSVRRSQSMVQKEDQGQPPDEELMSQSQGSSTEPSGGAPRIGAVLLPEQSAGPSDMDLMKEKFGKLLLGEDMSGSGKGVPSALALSNAVTNLAASVFGEQRKLEPMAPDRKGRWKKEVGWLLSVADHIVEFVAKKQVLDNGTEMEVMGTQQRRDLQANIPALRKLDTMLLV